MLTFSVPDSLNIKPLTEYIFELQQEHPEFFCDDFKINIAYGAPSFCIWNGNRNLVEYFLRPTEWRREVVDKYAAMGIKYRLNFTNFMLKEEHLYDAYSNAIAAQLNEVGGYVMVSTPMMAEYMGKNYPNLEIGWSTTTDFGPDIPSKIKKINELSANHLVVPPYNFNNKFELINQFTHPENIEFLADEKCISDCPWRVLHETKSNLFNLYENENPECERNLRGETKKDWQESDYMHIITRGKMAEDYVPKGFTRFKIEGRSNPMKWLMISYNMYFSRKGYDHIIEDFVKKRFPDIDDDAEEN